MHNYQHFLNNRTVFNKKEIILDNYFLLHFFVLDDKVTATYAQCKLHRVTYVFHMYIAYLWFHAYNNRCTSYIYIDWMMYTCNNRTHILRESCLCTSSISFLSFSLSFLSFPISLVYHPNLIHVIWWQKWKSLQSIMFVSFIKTHTLLQNLLLINKDDDIYLKKISTKIFSFFFIQFLFVFLICRFWSRKEKGTCTVWKYLKIK